MAGTIKTDQIEAMVAIVAALVKQGITFEVVKGDYGYWVITLTGGY